MLRKNIYKWHRTLSLIIAVPVLLWALSGFLHPIMTNIRPKVATQTIQLQAIDTAKIRYSLKEVLERNHIDSFHAFRIVHIANNWFYQVQVSHDREPLYFSALNGKMLTEGNWLYIQWLAKQFLEGVRNNKMPVTTVTIAGDQGQDCCDAATDCVLKGQSNAKVTDVSLISGFTSEYKSINRLLPVYRVAFDRADGIRVYVEPTTDRFAFAMDNKRRPFDRVFTLVHTWAWLDFLGKWKFIVEFLLVSLAFVTTLMGAYIFFSTSSKKMTGNGLVTARRNHRYTAIVIALFTLMFTFSGAYHALSKMNNDDNRAAVYDNTRYAVTELKDNRDLLRQHTKTPVTQIGLVKMNSETYWRIQTATPGKQQGPGDLMKTQSFPMPVISYYAWKDGSVLPDGERIYARYLAGKFSGRFSTDIRSVTPVTKFGADHNFTDKRLPVWRIQYAVNHNERYFIETATGSLSKYINDLALMEDYSFAFLHKHEFLGWAGKGWKDTSTMFWAMAQVVMVCFGLILYFRSRSKKKKHG
jgi:hypothetical protein